MTDRIVGEAQASSHGPGEYQTKVGDAAPKWPREATQVMKKSIVDDLVAETGHDGQE
ncbi:MAG: hypothetical protein L6R35_001763 [Caloplaca aegaea]|nr:MAG: hypothetical protein L6R35_001763 [Caloplaca aegaea]